MDKIEVSVTIEGQAFGYFTFCKPSIGECLEILVKVLVLKAIWKLKQIGLEIIKKRK